ncbi:hypothetical protein NM688_g63 [Phlebia brevispora]|uniref:Uncharacterized protein n=1 Tax=Phlebia brevispora TaxID=194682 RepID=A0ACC1TFM2_9APHY|nr:hypothetical protein NM688_g63 [Phlebia brevispora]
MPEYREVLVAAHTIQRWFDRVRAAGRALPLQALWADATDAEQLVARKRRIKQGHVFILSPTDTYARGPPTGDESEQRPLYPPEPWSVNREVHGTWVDHKGQPYSACSLPHKLRRRKRRVLQYRPLSTLSLQEVESTPRTIVFNMGELFFQAHLETHTTCQVYNRRQWDGEIAKVSCHRRGFRVALAFDFGIAIVAFVSKDLVFTPNWVHSAAELPYKLPDVHLDYEAFISEVAKWIEVRRASTSPRGGLAVTAIRDARTVFAGIGVYTVVEVFFLAGLSVFLTEYEVFNCPSRVARLCEAFWTFVQLAYDGLADFLKPFYHGYVLAATNDQRLKFSQHMHVYGKTQTLIPSRMYQLYLDYTSVLHTSSACHPHRFILRDEIPQLFDVFEPTYVQQALEKSGRRAINLGHWIFGKKEWLALGGKLSVKDLLAAAFEGKVWLHAKTHLNVARYRDDLFLPSAELKRKKLQPQLWRGYTESQRPLWSITPNFPDNVVSAVDSRTRKYVNPSVDALYHVPNCRSSTFLHVIYNTRGVVVGPLEFCGIARLLFTNSSRPILSVCRNSPLIRQTLVYRENAGIARIAQGRHKPGANNDECIECIEDKAELHRRSVSAPTTCATATIKDIDMHRRQVQTMTSALSALRTRQSCTEAEASVADSRMTPRCADMIVHETMSSMPMPY